MKQVLFKILSGMGSRRLLNWIPTKMYLNILYFSRFGKMINFNNPKTFNEKIQYLKVSDKNMKYVDLVDKYKVKNYIVEQLGEEYIIPTIWSGNNPEDIPFDDLPNEFVIKCNHGSYCNIICDNKSKLNIESTIKQLKKWLKKSWYWYGREWPYKMIERKIIIEKYMIDGNNKKGLIDYKFFCFNGIPKYVEIHYDRFINHMSAIYDMSWNNIHASTVNEPSLSEELLKPHNFEKMKEISYKLAKDLSFARIDLYEINNKVYFGEITLYPAAGFLNFKPNKYDKIFGDQLLIRKKNNINK